MFFIVASLIALLTLAYLVASGFVRVVRYFWGWLSSGEKINGLAGDAPSAASDAPDDAPGAAPAASFSKSKPTQAELSAYLDKTGIRWLFSLLWAAWPAFLSKKSGCSLPLA